MSASEFTGTGLDGRLRLGRRNGGRGRRLRLDQAHRLAAAAALDGMRVSRRPDAAVAAARPGWAARRRRRRRRPSTAAVRRSDFSASSSVGRSAAWAMRISTISAALTGRFDGLHLGNALEQHLPGARQHAHRQRLGELRAAPALVLRQRGVVGRRRHEAQPRHQMGELGKVGQHGRRVGAGIVLRAELGAAPPPHRPSSDARTGRRCGARSARPSMARTASAVDRAARHGRSPGRRSTGGRAPSLRRRARSSPARRRRPRSPSRPAILLQMRDQHARRRCGAGRSAGSATAP